MVCRPYLGNHCFNQTPFSSKQSIVTKCIEEGEALKTRGIEPHGALLVLDRRAAFSTGTLGGWGGWRALLMVPRVRSL